MVDTANGNTYMLNFSVLDMQFLDAGMVENALNRSQLA
jgi:hypothetical protein